MEFPVATRVSRDEKLPGNLLSVSRHGTFTFDEEKVSRVDDETRALSQDEYRITSVNSVSKEHQAAGKAKKPERQRDHASLFHLRGDPLDDKPSGKQSLSCETDHQPGSRRHLLSPCISMCAFASTLLPADQRKL